MFGRGARWGASCCVCVLFLCSLALAQSSEKIANRESTNQKYRIKIGDKLGIKFLHHPELSEPSLVVRPDGFISLQIIGEAKLEGLTVAEAKARLELAYQEILLRPEITVMLLEYVPLRYFVSGQVNKPGSFEIRAGNTLLQALTLAGGFTPQAHRTMVIHARPNGNKQLKLTVIDVTKLMKPSGQSVELELQDGDYIFVPDSKLSKLTRIVEAFRFAVPGYGMQF